MSGVGPVLDPSGAADPGGAMPLTQAIVAAMVEGNPGLEVLDSGAYVRVRAPRACRLERDAVERRLGRPFRLPADLEVVMPSFSGRFAVTEEYAEWSR